MIRMNSHKTVLMPKSLEDNQVQMDNICKAFNNGSASDAAASIGQLFRCRGMSQVSMASGIGRAVLYGPSASPAIRRFRCCSTPCVQSVSRSLWRKPKTGKKDPVQTIRSRRNESFRRLFSYACLVSCMTFGGILPCKDGP